VKRVKIPARFPFRKAEEKMEKGISNIFGASVMKSIKDEGFA